MTGPGRRTLRSVARPETQTRLGRTILTLLRGPGREPTIPFGSIALPTTGNGSIPMEGSESVTTRFILLGEARSGTSLLLDELNRRWPEIRAKGEIFGVFGRGSSTSFEEIARTAFADESGATIVGFKLFDSHATEQQISALLQAEGIRVIILRRRNPLRRYVSEEIAKATGRWSQGRPGKPDTAIPVEERRISIHIRHLKTKLQISENRFREFDRLTFGIPKIDVWYEDLVADLDGELRRIASFLGAGEPAHESPPRLERQNPEPLKDLIVNYDKVSRVLRRIGKSEYLLDEDSKPVDAEGTQNADPMRPGQPNRP